MIGTLYKMEIVGNRGAKEGILVSFCSVLFLYKEKSLVDEETEKRKRS